MHCQWTYKATENNPPAYAGRKLTALDGYFGVFTLQKNNKAYEFGNSDS